MPKIQPNNALALIGVSEVAEWYPAIRATAEGAHKLTEAIIVMAYHVLEEERRGRLVKRCPRCRSEDLAGPDENNDMICLNCGYGFDADEANEKVEQGSDIPPLMIGGKLNLAYEAVLRERALYYLQSLKLEADASTVEILADIFERQLYMHHPDQWGSLAEFLRNMAVGKSASYQSVVERLVTVILPFLQVEELCSIQEMMELITEGGMSNLYHLLPNLTMAAENGNRETMAELLTDAKSLRRSEIWDKYKRGKMRIPPAKATLTHTNPGWQLVIKMTEAQKGIILNRLGRRIEYEQPGPD